jgi:hypothetical protein
MSLPKKSEAYDFYLALVDVTDSRLFVEDPTIELGDFKVSKDGGAYTNLETLPVVTPSGTFSVKIDLSATEMDADKVLVQAQDVNDDEWNEVLVFIDVPVGNIDTLVNIEEGDRTETSVRLLINKKGTTIPVLDKDITGSLLESNITVTTREPE